MIVQALSDDYYNSNHGNQAGMKKMNIDKFWSCLLDIDEKGSLAFSTTVIFYYDEKSKHYFVWSKQVTVMHALQLTTGNWCNYFLSIIMAFYLLLHLQQFLSSVTLGTCYNFKSFVTRNNTKHGITSVISVSFHLTGICHICQVLSHH